MEEYITAHPNEKTQIVDMSHNRSTKAQKEYVRAIVHQLSLQRLSDTEIADYLAEKGLVLARNTVNGIKKGIERQAAKWYIELKQSQNKYIANYKERLDSLLSYQKILHSIIATTKREEIKIRAISELTTIEIHIFTLWKQLPNLDMVDQVKQKQNQEEQQREEIPPVLDIEDINGVEDIPEADKKLWHNWIQCDGCKRYWRGEELLAYHKKNTKCGDAPVVVPAIATTSATANATITTEQSTKEEEEEEEGDGWSKLQCPICHKWFMNNFTLSAHKCSKDNNNKEH